MSRTATWPAGFTSVGLGSLIVPLNVGWGELVTLSPTMLVSLAGANFSVPAATDGGVVLIKNESKKLPPG